MFRIQKILYADFREIYEPVLVENPFTQVDENGYGIRQLQIGLTTTKLLFGFDDIDDVNLANTAYQPEEVDPETETFKLISLVPLRMIKLQFFRRGQRLVMKMTAYGREDNPMYFEFGGHRFKNFYWHAWRDRVCHLHIREPELLHLTGASPFSSTDVLNENEVCQALVHHERDSMSKSELSWVAFQN